MWKNISEKNNAISAPGFKLELCCWHSFTWCAFVQHLPCDRHRTHATENTEAQSMQSTRGTWTWYQPSALREVNQALYVRGQLLAWGCWKGFWEQGFFCRRFQSVHKSSPCKAGQADVLVSGHSVEVTKYRLCLGWVGKSYVIGSQDMGWQAGSEANSASDV